MGGERRGRGPKGLGFPSTKRKRWASGPILGEPEPMCHRLRILPIISLVILPAHFTEDFYWSTHVSHTARLCTYSTIYDKNKIIYTG